MPFEDPEHGRAGAADEGEPDSTGVFPDMAEIRFALAARYAELIEEAGKHAPMTSAAQQVRASLDLIRSSRELLAKAQPDGTA